MSSAAAPGLAAMLARGFQASGYHSRAMLTGAGSLCLVLYSDLTTATTCPPRSTLTPDPWQRVSKAEVSATQGLRSDCDLKTGRETKVFLAATTHSLNHIS